MIYFLIIRGFVMNNKKAFTLTEVLLTIGIVGIVSAITLPVLIENYQKHLTVTRLKHAYSILSQAIEQAEAIEGDISNWDLNDSPFEKYIVPHIKNITKHSLPYNGALGITYKQISGKPETGLYLMGNVGNRSTVIYSLANGTQIFSAKDSGLIVDLNGFAKPNQFGKDLFYFVISKEHKLSPMGLYNSSECSFPSEPNNNRDTLKNGTCCNYGCNKKLRGMWCGALIMVDGWKIAPDYPW